MYFMEKFYEKANTKIKPVQGVPGGSVVEDPSTCRGHGSNPWSGKMPHAAEQLNPILQLPKPTHPRACALQQDNLPQ